MTDTPAPLPSASAETLPPFLAKLQSWRDADNEDWLTLSRHEVVTLIDEIRAAAIDAKRSAETLRRYRYAAHYASAESWDSTAEATQRLRWASSYDYPMSDNEAAAVAKLFHAEWPDTNGARAIDAKSESPAVPVALPPIETCDTDPTREYIPLPDGWEIQTKGRGSSYRLLDRKTEQRHSIGHGWTEIECDFVTRMAKEIHAAVQSAPPPAPAVREALESDAVKALADIGRWTLVLSSAVHHSDPANAAAVMAALKPAVDAFSAERTAALALASDAGGKL